MTQLSRPLRNPPSELVEVSLKDFVARREGKRIGREQDGMLMVKQEYAVSQYKYASLAYHVGTLRQTRQMHLIESAVSRRGLTVRKKKRSERTRRRSRDIA